MDPKKDIKKQLSINSIPKDWRIVKLKEIVKEVMNGFATGNRDNEGIVQIRMNNVTTDGKIFFNSFIKVPKPNNLQRFLLERGDLLFNNTNSYDLVGKSAIFYGAPFPCTFSNHFTRLRFQEDKVIPEWVLLNFLILWRRGYFKSVAIRHVGQSAVHTKYLLNLKIPLPPLPEQKKIAEILRTVDEAIDKVEEAIERTERLKKGLMQELLTKGIGHREFKNTDIGRIPKEWEILSAQKICTKVTDGTHDTPKPVNEGYYLITSKHLKDNKIDFSEAYFISRQDFEEINKRSKVEAGDVLFSMIGTIGVTAIVTEDSPPFAIKNVGLFKTQGDFTLAYWLYYYFQSSFAKSYINNNSKGTTQKYVPLYALRDFPVVLPPYAEQEKIINILMTVDNKLELLKEKKKTLEQLKKGLMNDLLTSRRRVKVEPPKETLF